MKSLPLIASSLYLEPWLIRPDIHADLSTRFRDYLAAGDPVGPEWKNPRTGESGHYHPQVEVMDGCAFLKVEGIVGKKLSTLEILCGGYDIALLQQQLANIRDDAGIEALVIEFDTPGGRAQGVEAAARSIREVSASGTRVIGYTDTCCCSAGYFMAAACDVFLADEDAMVGSISTICAGVDSSRQWEMEGLELKLVATGPLKAVGHPGKRWTEDEMEFLRQRAAVVDDAFKGFVRSRRRSRGMADEAMNGAHWYARAAPAGLVDGLRPSLNAVIEEVLASL
jgi:ClpP class serine protease